MQIFVLTKVNGFAFGFEMLYLCDEEVEIVPKQVTISTFC